MAYKKDFNIFIGAQTGAFKGVKVSPDNVLTKNLQYVGNLNRNSEISSLSWGDSDETDILIGTASQMVRIYDTEYKAYSTCIDTSLGKGPIVGVTRFRDAVTTCSESGHIKVWKYKKTEQLEINTKKNVSKMKSAGLNSGIVAIGGKDNDLSLWNLENSTKIFNARNVKKDMLELEVPVWISDMAVIPGTEHKIAVSTRHGQVRLYDTKAYRRPVLNKEFPEQAFNTIALCKDNTSALVGSGTGHLILLDFRKANKAANTFKGFTGSVRQVACHPTKPLVAGVGLDRFLRVYNLETRKLLNEEYLKVKLNCILMRENFGSDEEEKKENENEDEDNRDSEEENDSDIECIDIESDCEYNDIFDKMETVGDRTTKKS